MHGKEFCRVDNGWSRDGFVETGYLNIPPTIVPGYCFSGIFVSYLNGKQKYASNAYITVSEGLISSTNCRVSHQK